MRRSVQGMVASGLILCALVINTWASTDRSLPANLYGQIDLGTHLEAVLPIEIEPVSSYGASSELSRLALGVVRIDLLFQLPRTAARRMSVCSGFLAQGLLLTASHCFDGGEYVLERASYLTGHHSGSDGIRYEIDLGRVTAIDDLDLSIVELNHRHAETLELNLAGSNVGDPLFLIHHPLGRPAHITLAQCQMAFRLTSEVGLASHTCASVRGSSGAPLFDELGKVVGIHLSASGNDRFALFFSEVRAALESFIRLETKPDPPNAPDGFAEVPSAGLSQREMYAACKHNSGILRWFTTMEFGKHTDSNTGLKNGIYADVSALGSPGCGSRRLANSHENGVDDLELFQNFVHLRVRDTGQGIGIVPLNFYAKLFYADTVYGCCTQHDATFKDDSAAVSMYGRNTFVVGAGAHERGRDHEWGWLLQPSGGGFRLRGPYAQSRPSTGWATLNLESIDDSAQIESQYIPPAEDWRHYEYCESPLEVFEKLESEYCEHLITIYAQ